MALTPSFPAPTGRAISSLESGRALAGLVVRDAAGAARAGILPRHTNPLVTARADMAVDVAAFEAVVARNGVPAFIANDGVTRVPVGAAPSSNKRIDLVYVKQNQSASPFSDANNEPIFGYVSSDVVATPSLAQAISRLPAGALPLAAVTIPAGATATNSSSPAVVIDQVYPFTAAAGALVPMRTVAERDAFAAGEGTRVRVATVSGHLGPADYERRGSNWVLIRADGIGVVASAIKSSGQTAGSNNSFAVVIWDGDAMNSGMVSGTRVTVPVPGRYHIVGQARTPLASSDAWGQLFISGAALPKSKRGSDTLGVVACEAYLDLAASAYVELGITRISGTAVAIEAEACALYVEYLGPTP